MANHTNFEQRGKEEDGKEEDDEEEHFLRSLLQYIVARFEALGFTIAPIVIRRKA